MRRPRTSRDSGRVAVAALAALTLVGGWLGATREPAGAAFPGRNGKIVFASDRVTAGNPTGDFEIFSMNPDGTGIKQLTKNTASDSGPVGSPDGKQITFQSNRDGNFEIYTMAVDGGNQTRRTQNASSDIRPDWQPKPR
ncbi:MAG: PD40 domain-containing protein [Chloroflexia bacterium]|nr:PD40 domain-containing protein [Chloroflexia bacterium]